MIDKKIELTYSTPYATADVSFKNYGSFFKLLLGVQNNHKKSGVFRFERADLRQFSFQHVVQDPESFQRFLDYLVQQEFLFLPFLSQYEIRQGVLLQMQGLDLTDHQMAQLLARLVVQKKEPGQAFAQDSQWQAIQVIEHFFSKNIKFSRTLFLKGLLISGVDARMGWGSLSSLDRDMGSSVTGVMLRKVQTYPNGFDQVLFLTHQELMYKEAKSYQRFGLSKDIKTLVHECGHLYFSYLSSDQFDCVQKACVEHASFLRKHFGSSLYMMKSPQEFFCEFFAAWVYGIVIGTTKINRYWMEKWLSESFVRLFGEVLEG